jgi:hypothetical protein
MATPAATSTETPPDRAPAATGGPAGLWLVLVLTFLGSVGTGAVSNGIFFITSSAMGYARRENLWLGAVFGITYIAAALLAGPALRTLARRSDRVSTRGVLAGVLLLMALVCPMPLIARETDPGLIEPAVWAMVLVYAPATGVLWPIVESYLSGGRRARPLRSAVGRFNIVWSVALVGSYWAMAPLLEQRPFWILGGLGLIHAGMAGLVFLLPREPARHAEDHEPHPPVYEALLALFRVLLFASYLTLSAINPLQPIILDRLGVKVGWQMPLASVWLTARVLVFVLFERWHGWHGRWWTPWAGLGAMVAGFAATVASPAFGPAGVAALVAGLALMGAGVAAVYCGALYYALAVGSAEVDAGGRHEAVIGMGYFTGPLLGLAALTLAGPDPSGGTEADPEAFRLWTIGLVGFAAVAAGVWGWRIATRRGRA